MTTSPIPRAGCRRPLLLALIVSFFVAALSPRFSHAWELPQDLLDMVDKRRTLGFDYLSDILPSTSDCIGETDRASCVIDTWMACRNWNRHDLCELIGLTRDPSLPQGTPPSSARAHDGLYRFRYVITSVHGLDWSGRRPWPTDDHTRLRQRTWSPGPFDVAVYVKDRTCGPDSDCARATRDDPHADRHSCAQIDVCSGGFDYGLVLSRNDARWQIIEVWDLNNRLGQPYRDPVWFSVLEEQGEIAP